MIIALSCALSLTALAQIRQRVWARYENEMQDPVEDPPDAGRKGDFALGRLRYQSSYEMLTDLEVYLYSGGYGPTNEKFGVYLKELFGVRDPDIPPLSSRPPI